MIKLNFEYKMEFLIIVICLNFNYSLKMFRELFFRLLCVDMGICYLLWDGSILGMYGMIELISFLVGIWDY